jgi:hypothetical protein
MAASSNPFNSTTGVTQVKNAHLAGVAAALWIAASPAWSQLTAPQLSTPANGVTKWLMSDYLFSWQAVLDALDYQLVISESPTFDNFDESAAACRSGAAGCISVRMGSPVNTAVPGQFAGFWFNGTATYHWKVRALRASTRGPWSGVRTFTTTDTATRKVLDSAMAYVGKPAPQSVSGATWQTDMDGAMGTEIDTATKSYITCGNKPTGISSALTQWAGCKNQIVRQLSDDAVTEAPLADRIGTKFERATAAPTTHDAYLAKLGYLAADKEFADRAMTAGGLTPKTYAAARPAPARPGLYLLQSNARAGIIQAVRFLANGTPVARVIESNYPTTSSGAFIDQWNRPDGAMPWLRAVRGDREVTLGNGNVAADPSL